MSYFVCAFFFFYINSTAVQVQSVDQICAEIVLDSGWK